MDPEQHETKILPYAGAVIRLLQGAVFDDDADIWHKVTSFQRQIHQFFWQIGIVLHLDEREGFAYLSQPDREDEVEQLPRLVRRRAISYELTLLLLILRERLEAFDSSTFDATKCFITKQEIIEAMELLLGEKTDQVKGLNRIDSDIKKAVSYGFLKAASAPQDGLEVLTYEIRRIIKAKITNQMLETIREQLEEADDATV